MNRSVKKLQFSEYSLDLEYKTGIVADLVNRGGPWADKSSGINDERFPVEGSGVVTVRFAVIPGAELFNKKRYMIRRFWFEEYLHKRGMRLPNAAEALLFIASEHQKGEDKPPLTVFVSGDSKSVLSVTPNENGGRDLKRTDRGVGYYSAHNFLAVVVDTQQ